MTTVRALSSVAHNTAHHAASGLSYLHPHACRAARAAGRAELRVDLLGSPALAIPSVPEPLRLATQALRAKFNEILVQHGFDRSQLAAAGLVMRFDGGEHDCVATCELEAVAGKSFVMSASSA